VSKAYIATSYLIGAAFLAGACWLAWDWHWAIKWPLLAYLALATMVFPLARLPAEAVVQSAALWSPIELYGLLVWVLLAIFYAVSWALAVLFAPIGAIMHFAARRARAAAPPER